MTAFDLTEMHAFIIRAKSATYVGSGQHLLPYRLGESAMALATHLYNLATQINGAPESLQYATAVVLLGTVLLVNSTAIVTRVYLRARKRW